MKNRLKVSIITITYNNEKSIERTILSVLNQSYDNIEYIVVDGGSLDNTLSIVNLFSNRIERIISEPDNGIYDAINKGIRFATGDIVGLIHAGDELFDVNIISSIVGVFVSNDIDAIYGNSLILSEDGLKVIRVNISPEYNKSLFRFGWFPSHQSFYCKRSLFDSYDFYNTKYKIAADYELLLRFLYVNKIRVKRFNGFIVKFKVGGKSTKNINSIIQLNKECKEAWLDNGLKVPIYTFPFKLLRKVPQLVKALLYKYE